ncbi:MAG: hypothetical protein QXP91_08885 [Candidatus Methanomethylicia archaeon]
MPNKPRIIRDRECWLKEGVEQLGLEQEHQNMEKTWWKSSCLPKHRTGIFLHNINVNLRNTFRKRE